MDDAIECGAQRALKVALVAMPWARKSGPSGALGALSAFVQRERPGDEVSVHYAYLRVAAAIGFELYDGLSDAAYKEGELFYAALLYPEKTGAVRQHFETWARGKLVKGLAGQPTEWGPVFDATLEYLRRHVEETADACANADVVGMTTSFGQLFANVALSQAIKARAPRALVVIGGSTVSRRVGPSILQTYPSVDYIVQGEGERPLVALLDAIATGSEGVPANVLARSAPSTPAPGHTEVASLDALPYPDYDAYARLAAELGVTWTLPIEGSRGCWWDRTKRTSNPKSTCYFCNLNVQWGGYREKSIPRMTQELAYLSERYQNLNVDFLDNILRSKCVEELASAIAGEKREYRIFYELRASIRPYELLCMWEAGLAGAQFGIEALSTSLLRRIGKGTTTIQNLQAMKGCAELGIEHGGNLIVDFPGATLAEVEETRRNILEHAIIYQPLSVSAFHLGVDSTVDTLRGEFGITNVRNCDVLKLGLPAAIWERMDLFDLSFDVEGVATDWSSVRAARDLWVAAHAPGAERLLTYRDGGKFLSVVDRRDGRFREGVFGKLPRDVYVYCTEVRSFEQVTRRFAHESAASLRVVLDEFVAYSLVFEEHGKYLSLALAPSARDAARRIRALHHRESAETSSRARLPVVQP